MDPNRFQWRDQNIAVLLKVIADTWEIHRAGNFIFYFTYVWTHWVNRPFNQSTLKEYHAQIDKLKKALNIAGFGEFLYFIFANFFRYIFNGIFFSADLNHFLFVFWVH